MRGQVTHPAPPISDCVPLVQAAASGWDAAAPEQDKHQISENDVQAHNFTFQKILCCAILLDCREAGHGNLAQT